jgi:hypothetical protein
LEFKNNFSAEKCVVAAWDFSFIGEYENMLKFWDSIEYFDPVLKLHPEFLIGSISLSKKDSLSFCRYKPQNAIIYIDSVAKKSRIIIINEAHQQPMHRVFTESLLLGLYNDGFRYLGVETLSYIDSNLNKRKYPIMSTGFYSVEPQFGNLIRKALEIGFYVFPYESVENVDGKQREISQANNIIKILEKDSSAKVLIHCGFDHCIESYYYAWDYAMAGWLKKLTGINPLTIDQVDFTEASMPKYENPFFRIINLDYDAVFVDSLGNSFCSLTNDSSFDIKVYHPRTKIAYGRPNWVFNNDKIPKSIVSKIKLRFPCLVFAYNENEDFEKAVPIDIVEIFSKQDNKYLALYPGDYLIIIKNEEGKTQKINISVSH